MNQSNSCPSCPNCGSTDTEYRSDFDVNFGLGMYFIYGYPQGLADVEDNCECKDCGYRWADSE
jgi:hypothetical protein